MKLLDRLFKRTPPVLEAVQVPEPQQLEPVVYTEYRLALIKDEWTRRNLDGTGAFKRSTLIFGGLRTDEPTEVIIAELRERLGITKPNPEEPVNG